MEISNGSFCVSYAESSLTCKFELNSAILKFEGFQVREIRFFKTGDHLLTSNGAFCVSYAASSLTFLFELNTAILDFNRFEVNRNPIFQHSSRRPQMVRFVLVMLKGA